MGDLGFPIRYGILEVNEKINCAPAGTPEFFDIKVYLACKCYIMSEYKKYRRDGSFEEAYEVVYMFMKNGENFVRVEPIFSGNECSNKVKALGVYRDFSLASGEADELNKKAFRDFATTVPYDSNFSLKVKTGKSNYDKLLEIYKDHEKDLEERTKELNENIKKFTL